MKASATHRDVMVKRVPGGRHDLSHLSDREVLDGARRLVGSSNQLFAALLVHLAEVEARGLHRHRACATLYTYCIYELRMSEDAAARRSSAARWVRKFPSLLNAVARGELHLTGLLMIAPHLTEANQEEVLARARYRTKKELGRLVRELHPLPPLPDSIEPIGLLPKSPRNSNWELYMAALAGPVRNLEPGGRPHDWVADLAEPGEVDRAANDATALIDAAAPHDQTGANDAYPSPSAPPRHTLPPITGPQQYQMQFCTSEEHAELVEQAKSMLAKSRPGLSLGELHLMAMKLLVAQLERKKFAVPARSRAAAGTEKPPRQRGSVAGDGDGRSDAPPRSEPADGPPARQSSATPHQRGSVAWDGDERSDAAPCEASEMPRRRGRHVPAAVKREVYRRDEGQCSYLDDRGIRCRETRFLELHHLESFARGGPPTVANLTLRCTAHNALAAEQDFGREQILACRASAHERESEQPL